MAHDDAVYERAEGFVRAGLEWLSAHYKRQGSSGWRPLPNPSEYVDLVVQVGNFLGQIEDDRREMSGDLPSPVIRTPEDERRAFAHGDAAPYTMTINDGEMARTVTPVECNMVGHPAGPHICSGAVNR